MAIFKSKEAKKTIKLLKLDRKHNRKLIKEAEEELEDVVISYQIEKKINRNYSELIAKSISKDLISNIGAYLKNSDEKLLKIRKKIIKQDHKITTYKNNIVNINKAIAEIKESK